MKATVRMPENEALLPIPTAEKATESSVETEKQRVESPADYISHTMDRLINWSRVIKGEDIIDQPPRTVTQRLTETTLKVLAGYAVERPAAAKNKTNKLLNISASAVKAASKELKQRITTVFEKIFPSESTSKETLRQINAIFQDQIDNWWPSYVGRPEIDKREKNDGTKDEKLIQLDNPFRDPIIQREGDYTIGVATPLETNRKQSNFWDMAISTAFYDLREKIYQRRLDYEGGNASIAPLPRRPESGYNIIFQYDPNDESKLVKLNVPLHLVLSNTFTNFDSYVRLELKKVLSFDPDRTLAGQLNTSSARRLTNITATEYQKAKEEGYFDQLYHTQEVQQDLFDLNSPLAADLRICHAKIGNNSRLDIVQNNHQYSPMGVRIPTTYVFSYGGQNMSTAHVRSSHPFPDGREANGETQRVLKQAYAYATTTNEGKLPNAMQPEEKKLPESVFDPTRTTEFTSLTPETYSNDAVIVITLGENIYARETGLIGEPNPVDILYKETAKNTDGNLFDYYKKNFGINLPPAVVLNFALMKALGLQHTQFLDRNDNKLAPIICGYSPLFDTIHSQSKKGTLTPVDCQRVVSVLKLFDSERSDFRDNAQRKGRADAEVMSVAAGILKDDLSEIATYMSPMENEFLTNSVLTSMMLEPNTSADNEISMREFTTAIAANCAEKGAIGVCQTRKKDGLRFSYRAGTRNIVVEQFGSGEKGKDAFRDALKAALTDILLMLADVRKTLQKSQTPLTQAS